MPITLRRVGKGSQPETLSEEDALRLLSKAEVTSRDIAKEPGLDILVALYLYPNRTYEELLGLGFERFQDIWSSYEPQTEETRANVSIS
jgi:hypothetical protein